MDDLFYRKDTKPSSLKERAMKLLKNKRFMVRFVLATVVAGYVLFNNHGIIQRVRLQYQKSVLLEKIRQEEETTRRLQAESKALDGDPKAIERVAREQHGMIREGETVYRVNRK